MIIKQNFKDKYILNKFMNKMERYFYNFFKNVIEYENNMRRNLVKQIMSQNNEKFLHYH